jgi:hypothetical protein
MNPEVILEAIEVHASEMRAVSGERTTVRSKLSTYKRFFFLLLKLIWGYRWVNPCCHRAIRGTKFSWSWSLVMIVQAIDRRCSGLSLMGLAKIGAGIGFNDQRSYWRESKDELGKVFQIVFGMLRAVFTCSCFRWRRRGTAVGAGVAPLRE